MKTLILITSFFLTLQAYGRSFELSGLPTGWKASVTIDRCDQRVCRGNGHIILHKDGFRQRIDSKHLLLNTDNLPAAGTVLSAENSQSLLVMKDFNFDGQVDAAVRNGNNSLNRSASYDIYTQRPGGHFTFDEDLSELALYGVGLFEVDTRRQILITTAQTGCCFRTFEEWKIFPDEGWQEVGRSTWDGFRSEDTILVTEEKLVKGRWEDSSRYVRKP